MASGLSPVGRQALAPLAIGGAACTLLVVLESILRGLLGPPETQPVGLSQEDRLDLYRLAYDEARHRLDAQEKAVDEIRSRSGILIGAATIVTSFLGSRTPDAGSLSSVGWLAIGAFVVCVGLSLLCLRPRDDWWFYFGSRDLINDYIKNDPLESLSATYEDLAKHLEDNHGKNAEKLKTLYSAFLWSAIALAVEVGLWLVDIAGVSPL